MGATKFDERFFESTRGRIVSLLQGGDRSVNELSELLGLSDNAVRAHLTTLERDLVVTRTGTVKGFRKPHFQYGLTADASQLFPKSYDVLFNRLFEVLKKAMPSRTLTKVLHEVGQGLGKENLTQGDLDARVAKTIEVLKDLGGAAVSDRTNGSVTIRSESCPFAELVAEHPEVCKIAESMVAEIVDRPVVEKCDRTDSPKCRFEIQSN